MLLEFQANAENLTPAEARIALYYLNGYEVSEIPELAGISINTVKKHNKNVYRKMKVSSKEELVLIFDLMQRCGRLEKLEGLLNEKTSSGKKDM